MENRLIMRLDYVPNGTYELLKLIGIHEKGLV